MECASLEGVQEVAIGASSFAIGDALEGYKEVLGVNFLSVFVTGRTGWWVCGLVLGGRRIQLEAELLDFRGNGCHREGLGEACICC